MKVLLHDKQAVAAMFAGKMSSKVPYDLTRSFCSQEAELQTACKGMALALHKDADAACCKSTNLLCLDAPNPLGQLPQLH